MYHHKLLLFFVQFIILHDRLNFSNALIGTNVRTVLEGEFPSVVCLLQGDVTNELYQEFVVCSGTFITNQHIITASHCLDAITMSVRLVVYGTVDVRYGNRLPIQWWITYNQWAARFNLESQSRLNDISILKINAVADYNHYPADISPVASNRLYGLDAVMVGCGGESNPPNFPSNFEAVTVNIIPNRECEQRANSILGFFVPVHDRDICTAAEPFALLGRSDSGGPLLRGNFILGINIGPYPNVRAHLHANAANYHVGIDGYTQFIYDLMAM